VPDALPVAVWFLIVVVFSSCPLPAGQSARCSSILQFFSNLRALGGVDGF